MHILYVLLLCVYFNLFSFGKSIFDPRKEQTNIAQDFVFRGFDMLDTTNIQTYNCTAGFSYHHSFKDSRIAQALFGDSEFIVSGSLNSGRFNNDFLADTFGLSQKFESIVTTKPTIISAKFISLFSINNPCNIADTFFRIYIPLVITKHSLDMSENVISTQPEFPFAPGYMDITQTTPQKDFVDALTHPHAFGSIAELKFGKVNETKRKTRIADIRLEYGGAVHKTPYAQCLLYGIVAIPTGNKNNPEFLFSPLLGTCKQVEFGLGLSAHMTTFENAITKILIHVVANLTSITKRTEKRSFDLKENGPLSRYLLVKTFDERGNPIGNGTPLINVTTLSCHVHNKIQMDGLIACTIHHNYNTGIIGYNPFIKSRDRVTIIERIQESTYGLKGIQNMFTNNAPNPTTESSATIYGTLFENQVTVADITPQFIKNSDIDPHSGEMPFQLTHKIFVAYEWNMRTCKTFESFFALGTEIEFEGFNLSETIKPTKPTLNQWGLFGSLRIAF